MPRPEDQPRWEQTPQGSVYVPPRSAVDSLREMDEHWTNIAKAIDNITAMNTQMREVYGDLTTVAVAHREEMENANRALREHVNLQHEAISRRRRGPTGPAPGGEPVAGGTQSEAFAFAEEQQAAVQQRQRIMSRYRDFQQLDPDQQQERLRQLNILHQDQTGALNATLKVGDAYERVPEQVVNHLLQQGPRDPREENIYSALNKEIINSLGLEIEKKAPETAGNILDFLEQSGIRQLQYGQLTVQDILRAAGSLSARAYQARTPLPGTPEYAAQQAQPPGIASRGLTSVLGVLGGSRGLGLAGQMIGVGQTLARVTSNIYGQTYGAYADVARSGQLTGEGFGAGLRARVDALRLGANPFDLISMAQGREIVQATRERGFTGRGGEDVMEGIRSVVNDLGIQVNQAADFFTDAMRRGGQSVIAVRQELERFDTQAHDLNMNINEYTQAILQSTQTLRQQGAGQAAPALAQSIQAALPVGFRGQEGAQYLSQFIERARGELVGRVGGGATMFNLTSQQFAGRTYQQVDAVMQAAEQRARAVVGPNASLNTVATYMSQVGPYTQGLPVDFIQSYLQRIHHGRGLGAQVALQFAGENYGAAESRLRGTQSLQVREMAPWQRERFLSHAGITTHKDATGVTTYFRRDGTEVSEDTVNRLRGQVPRALDRLSPDEHRRLTAMRMEVLRDLPKGTVTPTERRYWRQHAGDINFNVQSELRKISAETGRDVGPAITASGVTIRLKPGMEQRLFELAKDKNNSVGAGTTRANGLVGRYNSP
jgi:hypothetical protein